MKLFICILVFLCSDIAASVEEAGEKGFLYRVIEGMPGETIAWVLAFFALLNGLSNGLEKLSKLTPWKGDDKFVKYLKMFLDAARVVIDFCTAKGSKR